MKDLTHLLAAFFILSSVLISQITNIRVDGPFSFSPEEVTIAINYSGPDTLVAASNLHYYYYSYDAGQTWTEGTLVDPNYSVWGDPSLIFDASGNCYFGHLSNPPDNGYWIDRIVVQKSTDGGATWNPGIGVGFHPPAPRVQDKEWLAADLTESEYHNNLYMAWTEFDAYGSDQPQHRSRIRFSRSTDQGISWAKPFVISDVDGNCLDDDETTEGAVPAIGPQGEIFIAWSDSSGIKFDRSYDGGVTFGEDHYISDQPGGWAFNIPGISRCNGMPVTACDISSSPHRGTIYVMWSDQRNGVTDTDVFISKSTDDGDSWSAPKRVNDDDSQRHQFFPWMSVDPATGIIYILFYDRRRTAGTNTEVYIARSDDGGETFVNTLISESSFLPDPEVFFGDYTNIAAYQGKVYPIWMRLDMGDPSVLSVWTAPLDDEQLITGIVHDQLLPAEFSLEQNYPNPFNASTRIDFFLSRSSTVSLKVYDVAGRLVSVLKNEVMSAGKQQILFDAKEFPSGTYYYTLETDSGKSQTRKMILLK